MQTMEATDGHPARGTLPDGPEFDVSAPVLPDRSVRVLFGPGVLARVPQEARVWGERLLLISGQHEAAAARELVDRWSGQLVAHIEQVTPHVPADVAAAAVALARGSAAQIVVSVGGGSATGLAKAVARALNLPIVAVPTTYAGSEMTPIWGQSEQGNKTTGRDARVLPGLVVYDPLLTLTLPPQMSAASGMNAMAHALEALYAPDRTEVSTAVAIEAIRALSTALPAVVRAPGDPAPRTAALRGAWLAGWALGSTTMGLHHKLAHVIGGRHHLWHAGLHSALLPQVAAFTEPAAPTAFAQAADALGARGADQVAPALRALADTTGAPTALADLGLPVEAVAEIAAAAAQAQVRHPRPASEQDLTDLVRLAYQGEPPPRWPTNHGPSHSRTHEGADQDG